MKYFIIPIISSLFLVYIWTFNPLEFKVKTDTLKQIDSTTKIILDTVPVASSSTPPPPQIVYYTEPKTNLLSMSNEIITLIISLGNVFILYKQIKLKK